MCAFFSQMKLCESNGQAHCQLLSHSALIYHWKTRNVIFQYMMENNRAVSEEEGERRKNNHQIKQIVGTQGNKTQDLISVKIMWFKWGGKDNWWNTSRGLMRNRGGRGVKWEMSCSPSAAKERRRKGREELLGERETFRKTGGSWYEIG